MTSPLAVFTDCHAHVFTRSLPLAPGRRYDVNYDAPVAAYLAMLDSNGMARGVLVQPSFLGTDNRHLTAALTVAPHRLRGIAVVGPSADAAELDALADAGVVGVRLNLIGQPTPALDTPLWRDHLHQLAARRWQVELQCEAGRLPALLPPLLAADVTIVVDHFGRPDPALGVEDPGFAALLAAGRSERVWVKLSGVYRLGPAGPSIAAAAVPRLRDALGLERLVWGSDWPHTQFETQASPAAALGALKSWLPDPADQKAVLSENPAALFAF